MNTDRIKITRTLIERPDYNVFYKYQDTRFPVFIETRPAKTEYLVEIDGIIEIKVVGDFFDEHQLLDHIKEVVNSL